MSKPSVFQNQAFQQSNISSFNLVTQSNPFNAVFATKPLDQAEADEIEKLLSENFQEATQEKECLHRDFEELKQITSEIKSIGRQGVILMGERIHRAGELLKAYKDGAFTRWLETTFGSRKTGYNTLNYYTLYNELPSDELRQKFKQIPQRTAYVLASRKASIEEKAKIIGEHHAKPHKELICLIQEKIPLQSSDKRSYKVSNEKLLEGLEDAVEKLEKHKGSIKDQDRKQIEDIIKRLILITRMTEKERGKNRHLPKQLDMFENEKP